MYRWSNEAEKGSFVGGWKQRAKPENLLKSEDLKVATFKPNQYNYPSNLPHFAKCHFFVDGSVFDAFYLLWFALVVVMDWWFTFTLSWLWFTFNMKDLRHPCRCVNMSSALTSSCRSAVLPCLVDDDCSKSVHGTELQLSIVCLSVIVPVSRMRLRLNKHNNPQCRIGRRGCIYFLHALRGPKNTFLTWALGLDHQQWGKMKGWPHKSADTKTRSGW